MQDNLKLFWLAIAFNGMLAVINTVFFINNLIEGRWAAVVSFICIVSSVTCVVFMVKSMRKHVAQQQQRVIDILSGKIT